VYDLRTQTLLPFSPDIVVFYKLGHNYPTTDEARRKVEAVFAEVRERIVDRLWGENAEFVLQSTARSYAGAVEDKHFFFVVGNGNSGMFGWMEMNAKAFGEYKGSIASANLIYSGNSSGDAAKAMSWMVAARNHRLLATSELKMGPGLKIDHNTVKELSSGGDTFSGRQNHRDEMQFKMQGTAWAFANDMPEIMNLKTDDATQNRVVFIEMTER
jgi:phage/plasmid-associated DNA primase